MTHETRAALRLEDWVQRIRTPHLSWLHDQHGLAPLPFYLVPPVPLLSGPRFTLREVTAVVAQWLRRANPELVLEESVEEYRAVAGKLTEAEGSRPNGVRWFAECYIRPWLAPLPWGEVLRWDLLRLYAALKMRRTGPLTPDDLRNDFELDDLPRDDDLLAGEQEELLT